MPTLDEPYFDSPITFIDLNVEVAFFIVSIEIAYKCKIILSENID
jgi:hypothetical protein